MTGSRRHRLTAAAAASALLLVSCGGGGSSTPSPSPSPSPSPAPTPSPTGAAYSLPAPEALSTADVERIVAQAVAEAQTRGSPAVIAVSDRVGNILAVFRMNGAATTALVRPAANGDNRDAQNATIPATAGAIAKAVTGAYLSSGGNAFSTRTASMILQQRFPPAAVAGGLEAGPLYGVQFSQLPCSDLSRRYVDGNAGVGPLVGPKRSPLGLSADPGGFPLYRNGVLIGAVGVMSDADYGFDPDVNDVDASVEEAIALAATRGFEAPVDIRADRIPVDGTTLRYSDVTYADVGSAAPSFASLNGTAGTLVAVRGYFGAPTPAILPGSTYGSEASGLRLATAGEFVRRDAMILTDGAGTNRYPIRAGTDGASVASPLTSAESRAILEEAFTVMARARAQIRRPLDAQAQVTISLVDTTGAVLGMVRSPDAPIFGIDVSLQKARSAMFLSHPQAGAELLANASADVRGVVGATRTFLNDSNALTGTIAFSNRAIGNLHRPFFPDGELGRPPGPLSRDNAGFNPLSTGLQSALIAGDLVDHLLFLFNVNPTDVTPGCTTLPNAASGQPRLANGLQIFPGAVPIYRGTTLIGAVGVSGDGIDQDDMISFLGLSNGAARAGGGIGNAPLDRRSDRVVVRLSDGRDVRLRWVGCPFAPFLDTSAQNVCQGL